MNYDEAQVLLVRETMIIALKIASPILLAGVIVGLIISLLQSVTSIQDQTLSFVPKIAAMMLVAALLIPWIVIKLIDYSVELFSLGQ